MQSACSQIQQVNIDGIADRELDEALWQSGTQQVLAVHQGRKNTTLDAAAAAPIKRRDLEQVCIKLPGHVHACQCHKVQPSHFASYSRAQSASTSLLPSILWKMQPFFRVQASEVHITLLGISTLLAEDQSLSWSVDRSDYLLTHRAP